jgi:iron complex outermembrane receptor protein
MPRQRSLRAFLQSVCVTGMTAACVWGAPGGTETVNLADVSLEELMKIEVTSLARRRQELSRSAAAVYVITQEDIILAGATSIAEALRLAPGLMVARIDASKWSVGARGDSGRFAGRMLVLIDGRIVYNNLYSGVYWEQNDTMVTDIERIEVLRGPGGSMWGANAVNAVVNVITRSAEATQGLLVRVGTGTEERVANAVRYGGRAGDDAYYRGYVKYVKRSPLLLPDGSSAGDDWSSLRAGGRIEWRPSQRDRVIAHGDLHRGAAEESVFGDFPLAVMDRMMGGTIRMSGGYGLVRWERSDSPRSETTLQVYFNREKRQEPVAVGRADSFNVDYQRDLSLGRHNLMMGGDFRLLTDAASGGWNNGGHRFSPDSRTDADASAYLQDDYTLRPDRLVLSGGAKLQHNNYTGLEWQPSVRLLWTPRRNHSLWAAASRAVHVPSRRDHDLVGIRFALPQPAPPGSEGVLRGNRDFLSERLRSYEAGWRWRAGKRLAFDLAGYLADERGYGVPAQGEPMLAEQPFPHREVSFYYVNGPPRKHGGMEVEATWQAHPNWRLQANYSGYWGGRAPAATLDLPLGSSSYPPHQAQLRSAWTPRRRYTLSVNTYLVSHLPGTRIPGYVRLDARFAARAAEQCEFSFGVRDALDPRHPEFVSAEYVRGAEARRSLFVSLTWGN